MIGLNQTNLIDGLIQEGMPWHGKKEMIGDVLLEWGFTERWNWTPEYIKTMDEDAKDRYKMMLHGVNEGENQLNNRSD